MTDPENWPLLLKLVAFPPIVVGGWSMWAPLAKTPNGGDCKLRA